MYYLASWEDRRFILIITEWTKESRQAKVTEIIKSDSGNHRIGVGLWEVKQCEILDQDEDIDKLRERIYISIL